MKKPNYISILFFFLICVTSYGQNTETAGTNNHYVNGILEPSFFDQLLGDYVTANKEIIVIGRSQKKLFAYFENTREYRGLNRINDTTWTAGNTVIDSRIVNTYIFKKDKLEIFQNDNLTITAIRKALYSTENISFENSTHLKLGGTIFKPLSPNGKAIVLVHGSGNQDRNGNNSGMRLLADILARNGTTVLSFDKQGVGSSEGNWEKLNFTDLAKDALSGLQYLGSRKDLKLTKIGLGGYSQAGWVIARAIQQSKNIDFVVTINAAGSGITVADQNIYDVKTQLNCENQFSARQKEQITLQQKYFFDYLLHRKNGNKLDELTATMKKDTLIKEWLYPNTSEIDFNDKTQWYNALEVGFNPLPTWAKYQNPTLMVLSEFDDSTPAATVLTLIKKLNNRHIDFCFFKDCQHLGLLANSLCDARINSRQKFVPGFFSTITAWLSKL